MQRPRSIVLFERCYLAAIGLGLVNTIVHWDRLQALPAVQRANAAIGAWYTPTVSALGVLIPLLLAYLIARRGSNVARWVLTVFTVVGVLGPIWNVISGAYPGALPAILSISATVLTVIAVWLTFQRDAAPWFGRAAAAPAA